MVWRGLGLGRFSAPCNKYRNPHVLRNDDSAHFLASFCYWLKSWWDGRARENWERLWEPSEGLPVYCVSIGSSASASRTFEHRCLHAPPPPKKKKIIKNSGKLKFVDFCCSPQCVCVLLSLSLPLWIVDPGHISGPAVRTQRHYVSARSRFDGRLSLRLLNRGRLRATLRDSSRNSLCGQLIGRSVALSGARRTHCWGVPNTPNWHFLWFFPGGWGGPEIKDALKTFHGMNPTTWYMVRQSPASFSGGNYPLSVLFM